MFASRGSISDLFTQIATEKAAGWSRRSLPELAQALLEEQEQVMLLKWQQRQPSWEGWLVGIDAQAEVQSFNALSICREEAMKPVSYLH